MRVGILRRDTNLRDKPNHYSKIRANIGGNRNVELLGEKAAGPWIKVRVLNGSHTGSVGWMHSDNIDMDS